MTNYQLVMAAVEHYHRRGQMPRSDQILDYAREHNPGIRAPTVRALLSKMTRRGELHRQVVKTRKGRHYLYRLPGGRDI